MSIVGYFVVFSDFIFERGYPSFYNLIGVGSGQADLSEVFYLPYLLKWQLTYLGLIFLMIGRLTFIVSCPKRLVAHGFSRCGFIESSQRILVRDEVEAMFDRVSPIDQRSSEYYSFGDRRAKIQNLLFPKYSEWARFTNEKRLTEAWRPVPTDAASEEKSGKIEEAELRVFFTDCLARDYDLAIEERAVGRCISFSSVCIGYFLLSVSALDLMQAVFRSVVCQ